MPLSLLKNGEKAKDRRIGGNSETKSHLADLGFVMNAVVSVIQSNDGNLIVNIKDSRLALTKEMASKIMVEQEVF